MIKVIGAVVLVLVVGVALGVTVLRVRKLRRDEMRAMGRVAQSHLPPAPYQRAQGFRLVDSTTSQPTPRVVQRPRLDPDTRYVFGETISPKDDVPTFVGRHDRRWALERSDRAPGLSLFTKAVLGVLVLAVVGAGWWIANHHDRTHHATTVSKVSVVWPRTLRATSSSTGEASYVVPVTTYTLVVRTFADSLQLTVSSTQSNTVDFSGTIAANQQRSVSASGATTVTLSTADVGLRIHQRRVILPATSSSTEPALTLLFRVRH